MNGDVVRIHSTTPMPVRRQVIGPRSGACRLAKCNVELLLKAHGTCNGFFQRQSGCRKNRFASQLGYMGKASLGGYVLPGETCAYTFEATCPRNPC